MLLRSAFCVVVACAALGASRAQPARNTTYGRLPLTFERNTGRYDKRVQFVARIGRATVFLTSNEVVMVLRGNGRSVDPGPRAESRGQRSRGNTPLARPDRPPSALDPQLSVRRHVLRMKMLGASASATAAGLQKQPGTVNYLIGNDPRKWCTRVPTYARATIAGVYPGIDVVYYGGEPAAESQEPRSESKEARGSAPAADGRSVGANRALARSSANQPRSLVWARRGGPSTGHGGRALKAINSGFPALEYDFVVKPGADPGRIRLAFEGADRIRVANGDLILATPAGDVRLKRPYAYQTFGGRRVQVACDYRLQRNSAALRLARYDVSRPLVVDPVLEYSTFIGTSSSVAMRIDAAGCAYVAGTGETPSFPTTPGVWDEFSNGSVDALVAKLNPAGDGLLFSTFIGGVGYDSGRALAVDQYGLVRIAGQTDSTDWPTTPEAWDRTFSGGANDSFVAELGPDGATLTYSTFIGGGGRDEVEAVSLDGSGCAYITGYTSSTNFPVTSGSFGPLTKGDYDAFVVKLDRFGTSAAYSAYLGGGSADVGTAICVSAGGTACVAGFTRSTDFPVTAGAFDRTANGATDIFVCKVSSQGNVIQALTYIGGSGDDSAMGIAVDAVGCVYVVGYTSSANYPTTPGAADGTYNGGTDAVVSKLSADGRTLVFSAFLGGSQEDAAADVAVDDGGRACVCGWTRSPSFPVTPDAFDASHHGFDDAFVTVLDASGSLLVASTFLVPNRVSAHM